MKPAIYRTPAKTRRRIPIFWAVVILLLAAVSVGAGFAFTNAGDAGGNKSAGPGNTHVVVCVGHVDTRKGTQLLLPAQSGRVVRVLVNDNDEVEEGAVLLELEDDLYRAEERAARADLEAAEGMLRTAEKFQGVKPAGAALVPGPVSSFLKSDSSFARTQQLAAIEGARIQLANAQRLLQKAEDLRKKELAGDNDVKNAEDNVKGKEIILKAEEAKLEELDTKLGSAVVAATKAVDGKRAQLEKAKLAVKECKLFAPCKGKVLRVTVNTGDLVGPQAKERVVVFCPSGPRIVRAEVEQEFVAGIAKGMVATFQDDSTAEGNWHGKVVDISDWFSLRRSVLPEPTQFHDVRTVECIIEIDPDQPPLRINQRVRVTIGR